MQQYNYVVVFITTESEEQAQKISNSLLKKRQAACVNIIPSVDSRFWWKDKLDSARESLLVVKTKYTLLPGLIKAVKRLHGYTVPEIIALPIVGGNQEYLDWIDNEVL